MVAAISGAVLIRHIVTPSLTVDPWGPLGVNVGWTRELTLSQYPAMDTARLYKTHATLN